MTTAYEQTKNTAMEKGVPLGSYLKDPSIQILLACAGCLHQRPLRMDAVVRRLEARGIDPFDIGVREIADLVSEACPCGARSWETRPLFPTRTPAEWNAQVKNERGRKG